MAKLLFASALIDEVALMRQVDEYLDGQSSAYVPSQKSLLELSEEYSIDFSTAVFYRAVLKHPDHGQFIKTINQIGLERKYNSDIELIIVPGMFYCEHPEVGSDGQLIKDVANQLGISTSVVNLKSTGSISDNTLILKKHIEERIKTVELKNTNATQADTQIWLISLSKGSLEVQQFLDKYYQHSFGKHLQGWVDICGLAKGSHTARQKLNSPLKRLFYRSICKLCGYSYQGIQELSPSHPIWELSSSGDDYSDLNIIRTVSVPLSSHLSSHMISHHKELEKYGPNDGFTVLTDYLELPGLIYPLWGVDHYVRFQGMSHLIYRILNYIQSEPTKEN